MDRLAEQVEDLELDLDSKYGKIIDLDHCNELRARSIELLDRLVSKDA
jgi:hypothetical protein